MIEHSAKRGAPALPRNTLFLLFRIGNERYALAATDVAEVLPRLVLKPIAQTPAWVAGVFAHRGVVVPVIDLSALTFGHPAQTRTSTRLVLVHYRPKLCQNVASEGNTRQKQAEKRSLGVLNEHFPPVFNAVVPSAVVLTQPGPDAERPSQLLGLILEQATDTLRCAASDFKSYGLDNRQARYLGPVREDEQGLLQWVRVQDLLSDSVRELLYPEQPLSLSLFEDAP